MTEQRTEETMEPEMVSCPICGTERHIVSNAEWPHRLPGQARAMESDWVSRCENGHLFLHPNTVEFRYDEPPFPLGVTA